MDRKQIAAIWMVVCLAFCLSTAAAAQVTKPGYLSRWTTFNTETTNDKAAAVVVDLGLQRIAPAQGYVYQASVLLRFQKPNATGLEELQDPEVFWQIEDKLTTAISWAGGLYYGMVTAEGNRDYYFYLTDSSTFAATCQNVMANFPGYTFQTHVELDPYWFNYFGLYPDEYTEQIQYNTRQMEDLLAAGDSLEVPRVVEHFANFRTMRDRDDFEREVRGLGYKILGKGENDGELKYGIVITQKHAVDRESIEAISLRLIDISMKNAGYYDGWQCEPVLR